MPEEEEKKEENMGGQTAQVKASEDAQPKVDIKADEPPAQPDVKEGTAKEGVEKKAASKKEKPANCAACNKSIKKKRWYYRNGRYYCTKRCWRTTLKKNQKTEEVKK